MYIVWYNIHVDAHPSVLWSLDSFSCNAVRHTQLAIHLVQFLAKPYLSLTHTCHTRYITQTGQHEQCKGECCLVWVMLLKNFSCPKILLHSANTCINLQQNYIEYMQIDIVQQVWPTTRPYQAISQYADKKPSTHAATCMIHVHACTCMLHVHMYMHATCTHVHVNQRAL